MGRRYWLSIFKFKLVSLPVVDENDYKDWPKLFSIHYYATVSSKKAVFIIGGDGSSGLGWVSAGLDGLGL